MASHADAIPPIAMTLVPLAPPATVLEITAQLERAGYEAWCVGGAVRDAMLGHPHTDWDLATSARPADVIRLFRHTVPVGVAHGTVGVLDRDGAMHEVTTFRRDVRTDGRHAEVEFGVSIDDDLARRDFTINAIAYSPTHQEIRDPFDGRGDLRRGVLRAVGVAADRMREDRLRALRALRFAARFGFEIEPRTWEAVTNSASHLTRLSAERVKQEIEKTMEQVRRPARAIRYWRESGALSVLVPALADIDEVTLGSLDRLPFPEGPKAAARQINRLTALFLGASERDARAALRALRFSNSQVDWIGTVVGRWATHGETVEQWLMSADPISDAALRRWVAGVGRVRVVTVLRLASARWQATRDLGLPAPSTTSVAPLYRRAVRTAFRDAVELADLAVDGDDLVRAGVPPGPQMGTILQRLLLLVLDDPSANTTAHLLQQARLMAHPSS